MEKYYVIRVLRRKNNQQMYLKFKDNGKIKYTESYSNLRATGYDVAKSVVNQVKDNEDFLSIKIYRSRRKMVKFHHALMIS